MRKNLLKTMLVAVGLVMGVNAWAEDVTTIYERGTTTNWTDTDISDWSGSSATVKVNNGLAFSAGNTGYEYKKVVTTVENSLLKLTATWNTGSSTGRSGGYNYIVFGDIEFRAYGHDSKGIISIAGTETTITTTSAHVRDGAVWNIEATINKATKEVNYSITLPNNEKKTGKGSTTGVYDALKIGFYKPGRVSSTSQTLVNIELTETKQEIQTANYTVKFTDEKNNEIKTADIRSGAVGDAVNITEADKQSFKTSDAAKKYIYESDDAENKTIAEDGSTIVTIKFREAETYHFTVYANVAGNKNQIDEGWEFEDETMYVNYPRYLEQDGTLYYINKNSSGGYFQKSFTLTQDNQEETINYTAGSKGVVYLAEAEKIEGLSYSSAVNSIIRCSNGSCAYNAGENDVVITTLPAGKYKLYTSAWGAAGTEFVFKAGDNKIASTYKWTDENKTDPVPNSDGLFTSKGYIIDYESEEITLLSETDITLGTTTDGSRGIDFVYIIKTGDATETVSIGEAGLATYCPTVGVDFTDAKNIEAYKATINADASTVTLTKVTTVAAGEGVLLRSIAGDAATEDIPVAVDAQKNDGNDFVGVTTDIESLATETDGYTNYILNNVGGVIGFYKAAGKSVAAGKAYLQVPTAAANAKSLKIVFGDTTGISEINNTAKADGAYYSISGVRVANPTKGLYIQNGKKVIVK